MKSHVNIKIKNQLASAIMKLLSLEADEVKPLENLSQDPDSNLYHLEVLDLFLQSYNYLYAGFHSKAVLGSIAKQTFAHSPRVNGKAIAVLENCKAVIVDANGNITDPMSSGLQVGVNIFETDLLGWYAIKYYSKVGL
tara:strand:+ start:685 stop:1098 length:414 start_codon:yes stop_codon:yes gene_type:complete